MTNAELIAELQKYPPDMVIHLDMNNMCEDRQDDRIVRLLAGVRIQDGYHALALDACDYMRDANFGNTTDD